MTEYASFEELTADDVTEDAIDLKLPSGKLIKVRGLNRFELIAHGKGTEDGALIEARNLVACMVQPKLTLGQAQAWQKRDRAGGDLAEVTRAIRELSGLGEGADKSRLRAVRRESGS